MKSQKFKRVIVVLLVTAMAVALPSSLAKYAETKNYTMTLTKHQSWQFNTYQYETYDKNWYGAITATYQNLYSDTVTLPYAGRYAIIAKGGDGAKGLAWAAQKQTHDYDVDGGVGGTVVGVYTTTKENQNLFVAPGFAGTNQVKNDKSLGGTNALDKFGGGEGGKFTVKYGDVVAWLGSLLSAEPAGGGGGAATVVYQCDESGNYSDADLLMIAGGGGGSPSWNQGYQINYIGALGIYTSSKTTPPGIGGMGGSNFGNNSTNRRASLRDTDNYVLSSALNAYCRVSYDIYDGLSGTGSSDENTNHFGTGGNIVGGLAGKAIASCMYGATPLVNASTAATNGSTFDNGGTGGKGDYYAGGGGGGYCGGGGGNGTSIDRPAGGAGGGSSYVSSFILQDNNVAYGSFIEEAKNKTVNPIPVQEQAGVPGANEGNGYVIIKYLGPADSTSSTSNIVTLDDILTSVVSTAAEYKPTSGTKKITNSNTSDSLYKALMSDSFIKLLLDGRVWEVDVDVSGNVTLYFSNDKNPSNGYNKTVFRYQNESMTSSSSVRIYSGAFTTSSTGAITNITNWKSATFKLT